MFGAICRKTSAAGSRVMFNAVRASHGGYGGVAGENLPFSIKNRYRLTAWFAVFIGSGLAAPFLVLRHQLLKQ